MMFDSYLKPLFVINTLLVLVDAALGYFVVPKILQKFYPPEDTPESGSPPPFRRLLAVVVTFYMFFNCFAYFGQNGILLLIITIIVLLDIGFQLLVRWKSSRGS